MRVLIVGCGYIGLPLGVRLVEEGHDVSGLRRGSAGEAEMRTAGIHPLRADITRPDELARLPAKFDWAVNCVATAGGGVKDYERVYLQGTRNLILWLSSAPLQKFVYTSSTGVYGQNDGSWVDESSPTEPAAPTARVLVETERVLLDAVQRNRFPAMILRVAGIYGPDRGYWLRQYLRDEARIEGKGGRFLNMVHRDDVVGAICRALDHGRPGGIYNVVDNEPVRQIDFFNWLADALGKPLPPSSAEPSETRKRGVTDKRVSNRKLKTELGYRLNHPTFRDGYAAEITRLNLPRAPGH